MYHFGGEEYDDVDDDDDDVDNVMMMMITLMMKIVTSIIKLLWQELELAATCLKIEQKGTYRR